MQMADRRLFGSCFHEILQTTYAALAWDLERAIIHNLSTAFHGPDPVELCSPDLRVNIVTTTT
jgi:hypothetical protein